jgi:hypothetical protein
MPKMRAEDRLDKHDRELSKHDKEIAAIRRLILIGMRLVNKTAAGQARSDKRLDRLEKNLEALIN